MLATMSPEEREAAERMERIAERAEAKARAKARAAAMESSETSGERAQTAPDSQSASSSAAGNDKPAFLSKEERQRLALERVEAKRREAEARRKDEEARRERLRSLMRDAQGTRGSQSAVAPKQHPAEGGLSAEQLQQIKEQYVPGESASRVLSKRVKQMAADRGRANKRKRTFNFEWDESDDTASDADPLYSSRVESNPLFGRGYKAGIDVVEQRAGSHYTDSLMRHRGQPYAHSSSSAARRRRSQSPARRDSSMAQSERDVLAGPSRDIRQHENAALRRLQGAVLGDKKVSQHWSQKSLAEMTERDWRIVREDHDIYVRGKRVPNPARNWDEMSLPAFVMRAIQDMGYVKPSPIQMQAIPAGLRNRDMIGVAETGSGKTCAFVVPLLVLLDRLGPSVRARCADDGPIAVVMAPTRELAQQIEEEMRSLARYTEIRSICIIGGTSLEEQASVIRRGVEVVVATPGRLIDLLEHQYLVFNQCNYVVLDEADRMIDMGFGPQVESVLKNMDEGGNLLKATDEAEVVRQEKLAEEGKAVFRTTIMFSATMPPEVEDLAKKFMRFPAIVRIGDADTGKNRNITQHVYMVGSESAKRAKLEQLLAKSRPPIIVFANAKSNCDLIARQLTQGGHNVCVLHSGKSQAQREANLAGFKDGSYDILVATDVAGRGLDVDNVTHVINYDMATNIERYTHRIGRTGRAGRKGLASTMLTEDDSDMFAELVSYLQSTKADVPRELASHPKVTLEGDDGYLE